MQRLHLHISVDDLTSSIPFYSALLGQQPSVEKPDYAKWLLDDPRVNLAISEKPGHIIGINHVGIQTETHAELQQLHTRLSDAGHITQDEQAAQCCYAISDKHWAVDPSGVIWEMFKTMQQAEVYGEDRIPANTQLPVTDTKPSACCNPAH